MQNSVNQKMLRGGWLRSRQEESMKRILLSALLASSPAAGQEISGIVVDSVTGVPLSKAEVTVENTSVITDSEGHFRLADLPPGQYRPLVKRNGYLDITGKPITLEAGQSVKDIQLKLAQFGVIAGTVRDEDGEGLVGIIVNVSRVRYERGGRRVGREGNSETDDLGQYRVVNLTLGRYYVRADRDPGPPIMVEVGVGQKVTGVDLTFSHPKAVQVSGHASVPSGTHLSSVHLSSGENGVEFQVEARLEPNGDFRFDEVPSGAYTLTAVAAVPKKPTTEIFELFWQGKYRTQVPFPVGAESVKGARISVVAGTEVIGHLNVAAAGTIVDFGDERAFIHDDQTFSVNLSQGHYSIDRQMLHGYFVSSVQFDGRDILDDGLNIAGQGKVSLEITLSKDGGRIDGIVNDKDGKPVPGAVVVLVPEASRRSHTDLFQNVEADQQGRYKIETIPPGEYKVFAWDEVEEGIWWDPDFLNAWEDRGEPVSIKAGSHEVKNLTSGSSR